VGSVLPGYAREKDRRLHETSCDANENARLAIERQGEVIKCLTELSYVLSRGMQLPSANDGGCETHTAPPTLQQ